MIVSDKRDIRDLSYQELTSYLENAGEKPFRAGQVFSWIYQKGVNNFDEMTDLSAPLKERLKKDFIFFSPEILHKDTSSDHTMKVLFGLHDKEKVETVLIPTAQRATVCVSTQAGCKFGCRFCASGIGGWKRNLSCAEIVSQILFMKASSERRPLSHIVFMGVGEPLDNYDNLIKAIRIINSDRSVNIGARRITISTCGVVPKILQLSKEGLQIELAVSLHGSSNDSRNVLMPVNKKYPVSELIEACKKYNKSTKRQITFEYILIKDVTCTAQAAEELRKLLKGMICKMNLIPYNPVSEFGHKTPSGKDMIDFQQRLSRYGIHATIRTPRGRDVSAACGQLRHSS